MRYALSMDRCYLQILMLAALSLCPGCEEAPLAPLPDGAVAADVGQIGFFDGPLTVSDTSAASEASGPSDATAIDADAAAQADAGSPVLTIYLSPTGDDAKSGLSPAQSILTLDRAQKIISATQPAGEVEVRIAPGDYYGQTVVWTYTMPNHVIRFMPLAGGKVRPVFDGCLKANPTDPGTDCPGGTWFRLKHSQGQKTNLHFDYIWVQRYQTAISLNGSRNSAGASNGFNRIYGCYFKNIGTQYNTALQPSTAAVRLVNSDDNEIANNHFVDVINHTSCGLLHAIYAAHMSDRNLIRANRFKNGCGDPLRFRDFSNYNVIRDNKLIKIGVNAGYTDWYCDHDVNTACTKPGPECPSWENQFRDNLLDGDYSCNPLSGFKYFQDETTTGCSPPSPTAKRLYTSGNTKTAVPCTN
jgi:hypothetical protein